MRFFPVWLLLASIALSPACERDQPPESPRPADTEPALAWRSRSAPLPPARPAGPGLRPRPAAAAAQLQVLDAGLAAEHYETRLYATEVLGYVPWLVAQPRLVRQLGDPEPDVRLAAIVALGCFRDPAAARLLQTVQDDDQEELTLRVVAVSQLLNPSACERNP